MSYPTAEELKDIIPMCINTPDGEAVYIKTLESGLRWYAVGDKNYYLTKSGKLLSEE